HLKENVDLNNNPFLPTNKHESVVSSLVDMPGENIDSTSTPVLKAGYNVTYEANLPSGCSSYNGTLPEGGTYAPLSVVLVPADAISCDGYNFMGWQDTNGSYGLLNGNYIRLKNNDVALKAIWSKVSIKKSMDGTIHDGSVARLKAGPDVNVALKRLVDPTISSYDDGVDGLYAIKTANSMSAQQEANAVIISSAESEYPIYAWFDDNDGTVYIYTEASTIMGNSDMSRLFQGIWELADASAVVDWDMSETTNLDAALATTGFLDLDDFANWDVSNVQSMEMLLYVDWQLEDISGLANWDVGNVTNMWATFSGTERVTDLSPLADWDVSKVVDMGYMFYGNMAIEDVDGLANWDVRNVQDMGNMFNNAVVLSDISGLTNWKTDSLMSMTFMFNGTAITNVDALEDWNVENVQNMYCLFRLAENLTDISGLANWDTGNVIDMGGMFHSTKISDTSPFSNWNTESAQSFSQMFFGTNITNIDGLADWETGNVESMEYMFGYTDYLTDISGASGWDTGSVTDMSQMFRASSITNINALANWNTENVTNMRSMFQSADGLTDISGASGWNVSNVEYLSYMFADDVLITYLKTLDGWDTSSVIEKGNMFLNIPNSVQRPVWWDL
ncbi:BspA family leucine-rich repeat surface protein, partial [Candidatus Saccharibacteria bacterium]|nr:BspA family leucine-rich repeat surface protein [Candidatus Saccharibacteria bacterium]